MKNRWTLLMPFLVAVVLSMSGCAATQQILVGLAISTQDVSSVNVIAEPTMEVSEANTEPVSYAGRLTTDWLVTADELDSLTLDSLGIFMWEEVDSIVWEYRTCRLFFGDSISVNPNTAMNCIFVTEPGAPFEQIVEWMYAEELLPTDAIPVEADLEFSSEHAVFASTAENGHTVFDGLLLGKEANVLFVATVTVATGAGQTPEMVYSSIRNEIQTVLSAILRMNMERLN